MKILMIEPNPHHFEVIPGFAYYFADLGYEVDCLLQKVDWYGDPFSSCPLLKAKNNFYYCSVENRRQLIEELQSQYSYDLVFLTSMDMIDENGAWRNFYKEIVSYDHSRLGVIGCCHALGKLLINHQYDLSLLERTVSLSPIRMGSYNIREVNANFFCDDITERKKNNRTSILSIGLSTDRYSLWHAIKKAEKYSEDSVMMTCISGRRPTLFHIAKYFVWKMTRMKVLSNCMNLPIPRLSKKSKQKYRMLGNVPFPDLFREIEEADFLDASVLINLKEDFSTNRTSGIKQLSLGFCKPCIIENSIAQYFGFTERNAVIYEEGTLSDAILRAIRMTETEYREMVMELKKMCAEVRERSKNNLKDMISKLENNTANRQV